MLQQCHSRAPLIVVYHIVKNFGGKKLWRIWQIALQSSQFCLPIITTCQSGLAMLKGWY